MNLRIVLLVLLMTGSTAASAATVMIQNDDAAGAGLNDPTPFTPVGGNNATTLGQARLNVFKQAAQIWGAALISPQLVVVGSRMCRFSQSSCVQPTDTCTSTSGTLGEGGPFGFFKNFANAPLRDVYYPMALANALANANVDANDSQNPNAESVLLAINADVDSSGCLGGGGFYYGLDDRPGRNQVDLLQVLVHEMGHGLGFTSFVDETTGVGGDPSAPEQLGIYDQFVYWERQHLFWPQMTAAQRASSAVDSGLLSWNGASVNAVTGLLSAGVTASGHLQLYAPNPDQPGSNVSHWDTAVSPNLLQQPFLSPSVAPVHGVDFTICALHDMGWPVVAGIGCPDGLTPYPATRPRATAQSLSLLENAAASITLSGASPDGSLLSYSLSNGPQHGLLSGTAPNLSYAPTANYVGPDSFSFTVSNNGGTSSPATISLNVLSTAAAAPTANPQSLDAVQGLASSITLSGSSPDGSALSYNIVAGAQHGTLSGTPPNLRYTATAAYVGADSFSFTVTNDAGTSAPASVTISVTAPPSSGGQSGGGAMPGMALLFVLAALKRLRDQRR